MRNIIQKCLVLVKVRWLISRPKQRLNHHMVAAHFAKNNIQNYVVFVEVGWASSGPKHRLNYPMMAAHFAKYYLQLCVICRCGCGQTRPRTPPKHSNRGGPPCAISYKKVSYSDKQFGSFHTPSPPPITPHLLPFPSNLYTKLSIV